MEAKHKIGDVTKHMREFEYELYGLANCRVLIEE